MKAEDIMKKPITIDENSEIEKAAEIMSEKGIGSLVVKSKGKLCFFVDELDVLRNFRKNKLIKEIMKKPSVYVEPDKELEEILEKMKKNKTRRVFVLEKGEIVGVISLIDVIMHSDELEFDDSFFFD